MTDIFHRIASPYWYLLHYARHLGGELSDLISLYKLVSLAKHPAIYERLAYHQVQKLGQVSGAGNTIDQHKRPLLIDGFCQEIRGDLHAFPLVVPHGTALCTIPLPDWYTH